MAMLLLALAACCFQSILSIDRKPLTLVRDPCNMQRP